MLVADNVLEEEVSQDELNNAKNTAIEDKEPEPEQIKPIAVVISSRKSKEENADAIRQLQLMALFPIHVYFCQNEGYGLSAVYNQHINQIPEDIVVFVHDDVEFISAGWARTLWNLFNNNPEYGIIGVAGSKDYDEDGAWWIYKNKYGQVFHQQNVEDKEGNKGYVTFRTKFSEKLDPGHLEEVCIIDGLFMAIHKKRTQTYFDDKIGGFNFYDINLCLENFKLGSTKIGVTTDIIVSHKGLGVIKPEWYVNRATTMEKYKSIMPIYNLKLQTPVEDKADVPAFKPENDPWKNGQIKILTPEEVAAQKAQGENKEQTVDGNGEENKSQESNQ